MSMTKSSVRSTVMILSAVALLGCESSQPGARAGAAVDRAGTATGNAIGNAATATGNALDRTGTYVKDKVDPPATAPVPSTN